MEQKFKWKVFISITLFFAFFIVLFSGIVLYLSPPGRIANWSDWNILGLSKKEWQSLHTVFSYTFAILSILHLFIINWRIFWSYVNSKVSLGLNRKKEILAGVLFIALCFAGTRQMYPPFSSIITFGETLKHSWENYDNHQLTKENRHFGSAKEFHSTKGQGKGYGRMTVEDVAKAFNSEVSELITKLENNNLKAEKFSTLRDVAASAGTSPKAIYDILSGN